MGKFIKPGFTRTRTVSGKEKQVTHTNTRQEQHHKRPHEGPPLSLNNDRRWRDDGAYHLPHLDLYTILPLQILYGAWHTRGGSGGGPYSAQYCVWAKYTGAK